jgi:hypothetical protein
MKRLRISLKRSPALEVDRVSIGHLKLVYVICADKKVKYPKGRSRIAYIGTTQNGIDRVAQSAAIRSDRVLNLHGVNSFQVRIVTCTPRQHVKTWHKLERALILYFRDTYGAIPICNEMGNNMTWRGERDLFAVKRLWDIIEDLS